MPTDQVSPAETPATRPIVFVNGPIFGVRDEAVALHGGRIAAIGDRAEVAAAVGVDPEWIDLDGRMLLPGFQDAHVHPVMGGLMRLRCNLEPATDLDTALALIRAYAADHPTAEWILGGGWSYSWFPDGNPPASLLDAITDRPMMFGVADGHSAWVNSTAFRLAGIDASTPDPEGGVIVRRANGMPQGTLHEAAMDLMDHVVPPDSPADITAALAESHDYLVSLGITAWQDAWVTPEIDAAYRALAASGRLRARVRGAQWWDRGRGLDQLDEIVERASDVLAGYVPRTVKLMLDGVCENHTAAMLHPYLDRDGRSTSHTGVDFIARKELVEIVTAIDAVGLQCHFHALGDRAVRNALDAIEEARRVNGSRDTRPHLAHLQMIDPADVTRFAGLGATANIQPYWACADPAMTELTIPFLPPDRVGMQYPFASLHDAGARLAMGSDWSVSTPDVLQQIEVAVHRTKPSMSEAEPFLPEQGLSLGQALTAVTAGSAHVNFFDGDSGTIEIGTRADLVVLDADPMQAARISDISVDLTIIGGEIVHRTEP